MLDGKGLDNSLSEAATTFTSFICVSVRGKGQQTIKVRKVSVPVETRHSCVGSKHEIGPPAALTRRAWRSRRPSLVGQLTSCRI